MKLPSRLRGALSVASELATVAGFFGWTVTGLYALAVIATGWLSGIPWFWVLVCAPAAAFVLVATYAWLLWLRRPKPTVLDLTPWEGHPSYRVWIAACIWIEQPPSPKIDERHTAYPMLQRIKSALQTGKIKSLHGGTGMEAEVARTEFIKLAKLYNERPRSLFPDR